MFTSVNSDFTAKPPPVSGDGFLHSTVTRKRQFSPPKSAVWRVLTSIFLPGSRFSSTYSTLWREHSQKFGSDISLFAASGQTHQG